MIGGNSYEFSLAGLTDAAKTVLGGAYPGLLTEYRAGNVRGRHRGAHLGSRKVKDGGSTFTRQEPRL